VFLQSVLRGDLGRVETPRGSVALTNYWRVFPNSAGLLVIALLEPAFWAYWRDGCGVGQGKRDHFPLLMLTLAGISAPSFFCWTAAASGRDPLSHAYGPSPGPHGRVWMGCGAYADAVAGSGSTTVGLSHRATFVSLGHVLQEDYMRTAFAKGLALPHAVLRHALRNMSVSLIHCGGVSLASH